MVLVETGCILTGYCYDPIPLNILNVTERLREKHLMLDTLIGCTKGLTKFIRENEEVLKLSLEEAPISILQRLCKCIP